MFKEGAYAEQGENESIEHEGLFEKKTLERILESRHTITDFGKSGIVFRISPEDLSLEEQARLATVEGGNEENPEGALSIKALKVFNLDLAKKEFEALQEAREIIREHRDLDSAPTTRIPRAFGFDEIHINEDTQNLLNENGASIKDGRIGIITMDWIEGKDLSVVLKEELLKRTPENEDTYPGQEKDIRNGNFAELLRSLEKKGFVLPKEIVTQIKNTTDALHKKNFYHNDLHLRNLILKDGDLENPQLYMIDFEDAGHEKINIENAEGKYFLSDENIIKSLIPLTKTPEEKNIEQDDIIKKEWEERIAIVEKQPKAIEQYKTLKDALGKNDQKALDAQFAISSSTDTDFDNFLGNLLRLSREDNILRDEIKIFLRSFEDTARKRTKNYYAINRIQALGKVIEA